MNFKSFLLLGALLFLFPVNKIEAQNEFFLRRFEFELTKLSKNFEDNEFYLALIFNRGIKYKFSIANKSDRKGDDAIVELHDGEKLVGSNMAGTKYFSQFFFQCNKTGLYKVIIKFKNKKIGSCIIDLYMVNSK
jgi:hypothetical protein